SLDEVYGRSDIITLHVPLLDATKGMIDKIALSKMKDGIIILNMARGALVKTDDLKVAISSGKVRKYIVDFPDEQTINSDGIIVLPHLGASTEEAEDNCAEMAAKQLKAYIEEGTIKNSVNFPAMEKPRNGDSRVCVLFLSEALPIVEQLPGDKKIAIKGSYGYAIIDNDVPVSIPDAEGILRVRTL
ncbi:MAG: 3-phosphoglycerate dehydrogenase, partial [Clostridia bacterium]|nr:3-phosphoglycerate dehydrogenase [Clostridia bacterium]